jgi:hypothetical protein
MTMLLIGSVVSSTTAISRLAIIERVAIRYRLVSSAALLRSRRGLRRCRSGGG